MRSFVGAGRIRDGSGMPLNHKTGAIPAYTLGKHEDTVFTELKALPEPFGISKFYTDRAGVYMRHTDPMKHEAGRKNIRKMVMYDNWILSLQPSEFVSQIWAYLHISYTTRKIERKHLTLRTRIKRLARKTICFSKLERMHDIVIGLFISIYEFGLAI